MSVNLTLGSLFDGIGVFPLAAELYGIKPLWASEILPSAIDLTRRHFPGMEHLGDITVLDGGRIPPVDIITGGSPCQDMSMAGYRKGINAKKSGLFFEMVRIINEMMCATNGLYPRFVVWENVHGAFSSGGGDDFRQVLAEIVGIAQRGYTIPKPAKWRNAGGVVGKGWSVAWRTLEASGWGVLQRRKRIFLAADFAGERAGEILFKREGLRGYPLPCGKVRENRTFGIKERAGLHDKLLLANAVGITAFTQRQSNALNSLGDISNCLAAQSSIKGRTLLAEVHPAITGPLLASGSGSSRLGGRKNETDYYVGCKNYDASYIARRLTPVECERLMGLPFDGWTEYGIGGKRISDSRRYEMLGNSIVVQCAAYVMEGIADICRADFRSEAG